MRLINPARLVQTAFEEGYAVPAFNTNGGSYDITRAAVEAAGEMGSPLILQTYEGNLPYRGPRHSAEIARFLAAEATVPVALALDHGHTLESCREVLEAGYTAIMFDGSEGTLEENIAGSKKARRLADQFGAALEAEVGHLHTPGEDPDAMPPKTDPDEAAAFLAEVGVDYLAVAIGTRHGLWKEQKDIDFELLGRLRDRCNVPLVQHGTGGVSLDDLARLAKSGIAKANFGEVFRAPYIDYFLEIEKAIDHAGHPWKIQQKVMERLKEDMKAIIAALGSEGKAR
jgi:ketose-bisphosphate aldolase